MSSFEGGEDPAESSSSLLLWTGGIIVDGGRWWVYFVHGDDSREMDGWESRDENFLPAKMAENWRVDKDHMQSGV
jgi:hypothetical protein